MVVSKLGICLTLQNVSTSSGQDRCTDLHKKKNPSGSEGYTQRIFSSCSKMNKALYAESEGFEPSIPFRVYTLSRRAPSTTRTTLLPIHPGLYTRISFLMGSKNTLSGFSRRIFLRINILRSPDATEEQKSKKKSGRD